MIKCDIPTGIRPLNSHLFTIEKCKADVTHDKIKSSLISHGNEQDVPIYPDRSSPMMVAHLIMTGLAAAVSNEDFVVRKLDITGAIIKMEMTGSPIYIRCTGELKHLIVDVYPSLKDYVGQDGVLY
jgi:hypothetical protein